MYVSVADGWTIKVKNNCQVWGRYKCQITTGDNCKIKTNSRCRIRAGDNCKIDIDRRCYLKVGKKCNVESWTSNLWIFSPNELKIAIGTEYVNNKSYNIKGNKLAHVNFDKLEYYDKAKLIGNINRLRDVVEFFLRYL